LFLSSAWVYVNNTYTQLQMQKQNLVLSNVSDFTTFSKCHEDPYSKLFHHNKSENGSCMWNYHNNVYSSLCRELFHHSKSDYGSCMWNLDHNNVYSSLCRKLFHHSKSDYGSCMWNYHNNVYSSLCRGLFHYSKSEYGSCIWDKLVDIIFVHTVIK